MVVIDPRILTKTVKAVAPKKERIVEAQIRGTVVYSGGEHYIQLDGATGESLTPIANSEEGLNETAFVNGDRVLVLIKNHQAIVTKNITTGLQAQTAKEALETAEDAAEAAHQATGYAQDAHDAAEEAKNEASEAKEAADSAVEDANAAYIAAEEAKQDASDAKESATEAKQSAEEARESANEAKEEAQQAHEAANNAQADAIRANTAANGAVTSLGIVQGVVDDLGKDMDDMQTHVAMMDAVRRPRIFRFPDGRALKFADGKILTFEDPEGEILVPAGLHVVPTSNGYFVVLSNDGMYVYDNESSLVATFGESIIFSSIRPQRIGGEDAYIEYYDSNLDGKADSIRIVGASISSSTGIPTKVSELTNDLNFADTTAVAAAKKAGDDAQADLNAYKTSNNARVGQVESAVTTNAKDLTDYIESNEEALEELQRQIDGAIDTWYYAVDPTTSNEPAVNWTSEAQKESHLRDLYFNTTNGHSFRWAKENNTYKWIQIEDADAIKALADAAKAQDTADNKRRVFVTTPTPPYDIGDLWTGGSNGDIKRCKTPKTSSQSFADSDWELASKYTDDTQLEAYKTVVSTTYTTKVETRQTQESLEADISAVETSVTEYADGLIEQEVIDRNSAITQTANGIRSDVSATYATKTSIPTAVSQLTNDSDFATNTEAQGYASTAETNAKADTASKLTSYSTTAQMNSAISQSATAISAQITASETASKEYADGLVEDEVTARNAAITASANAITSTVSQTYATKSSVPTKVSDLTNDSDFATKDEAQDYADDAEANAIADTTAKLASYSTTTEMNSAISQSATNITSQVSATYATKASVPTAVSQLTNDSDFATTTQAQGYADDAEDNAIADTTAKLASYSTTTEMNSAIDQKANAITLAVSSTYETKTDATGKLNTAKGYTDTEITSAKAAIKVTTDSISSEVSNKVGNNEVISRINQSAENIRISANKVDIEGAAIFSQYATKSELDTANTKISSLEDDVSDMIDVLDLGVAYQWGTDSVTVTAVLIKNGEDIHEQVSASLYEWEKETQSVKTSLGTGYQKVIPRADLGYMSAVTVYLTKGEPVEFRFPDGSGLNIHGKDALAISV